MKLSNDNHVYIHIYATSRLRIEKQETPLKKGEISCSNEGVGEGDWRVSEASDDPDSECRYLFNKIIQSYSRPSFRTSLRYTSVLIFAALASHIFYIICFILSISSLQPKPRQRLVISPRKIKLIPVYFYVIILGHSYLPFSTFNPLKFSSPSSPFSAFRSFSHFVATSLRLSPSPSGAKVLSRSITGEFVSARFSFFLLFAFCSSRSSLFINPFRGPGPSENSRTM